MPPSNHDSLESVWGSVYDLAREGGGFLVTKPGYFVGNPFVVDTSPTKASVLWEACSHKINGHYRLCW